MDYGPYVSKSELALIYIVYFMPLFLAFVCGSIIGSLSNVVIYRLPLKKSIWHPPSHCPKCETRIAWYDNIPFFSYIRLRARCRHCKMPISPRYIIVEFLSASLYVIVLYVMAYIPLAKGRLPTELPNLSDLSLSYIPILAKAYIFSSLLLILSFIDLDIRLLPNRLTFPGMLLGFILSFVLFPEGPKEWRIYAIWLRYIDSILGLVLGGGVLFVIAIIQPKGMGGGDIKLCAMMGAFLGWKAMIVALFLGFLAGAVSSVLLMIMKIATMKTLIPFGPYLALGGFIAMLYGKSILWIYYITGIKHDISEPVQAVSQLQLYLAHIFKLLS